MSSAQGFLDQAFGEQKELRRRSREALAKHPELENLFVDISQYIITLRGDVSSLADQPSKKRKLDNGSNGAEHKSGQWKPGSYSTIRELSFTIPQRKKLSLDIGNNTTGIQATNPTTTEPEFGVEWTNVSQIICVPVPEKAQAQYNVCVFPFHGDGLSTASDGVEIPEQMLWTVPNTAPKPGICSEGVSSSVGETYKSITLRLLNERLRQKKGNSSRVIEPDPTEFTSEAAQPYKKGDKAVHVKAFRGSKDGFLFFLPTGILWGFKKPLILFSFDSIDSVSYTSVLQRTFNLNINARGSAPNSEPQEYEFSMIDQAEFAGIDAYIKRNQLQDASMAEQRRAKRLNVNGVKGEKDGEDEEDGPGELQKAAQEAAGLDEDDEEEDDENFDPGSEGESEGSGTSDEEEGENGPAGEGDGADDEEDEDEVI